MTRRRRWLLGGTALGGGIIVAAGVTTVLMVFGYLSAPGFVPRDNERFGRITLRQAGGVAGSAQSVTVRPDGRYERFRGLGERAQAIGSGRFPAGRLAEIRKLATSRELAAEARRPGLHGDGSCLDGFQVTLTMHDFRMWVYECGGRPDVPTFWRLVELLSRRR